MWRQAAAAATGLARSAAAWRRRRAAGETAGGRAWQVRARPRERSVVEAGGSGGHGAGTECCGLEEAPRSGGDSGRPRLAGKSTPQGAQRCGGRRQRSSSSQAVGHRAGRGRGGKEGPGAKGGAPEER